MRPQRSDYPDYFDNYVPLVKQDTIIDALADTKYDALEFIKSLDPALEDFAYADGKWTIKEVLIHCIDTERIFSTRALGIARGETQKALSYDENVYAANSHANERTFDDIAEEFELTRNSTLFLFHSFSEQVLALKGEFPAGATTVNAVGFTICGHTAHHLQVIRERYLKKA
jgi:DinB family protein